MSEDKAQLQRQLTVLQKNLQALQERRGSMGPAAPPHLSDQIRRAKAEIARIEAHMVVLAEGREIASPQPGSPIPEVVTDPTSPEAQVAVILRDIDELLVTLTAELEFIPGPARSGAETLLTGARQIRQGLVGDSSLTLETVQAQARQLERLLKPLNQRRIHRRRLAVLREKLDAEQQTLNPEELAPKILPRIKAEEATIAELESTTLPSPRNALEAKVQEVQRTQQAKLLTNHRRELALYREMLAGQRSYAPVDLLNSVADTEAELTTLDQQFQEYH
jgi:hypothetical protein